MYMYTYKGKATNLVLKNQKKKKHKQTHWKLCSNEEFMLHVCVSITVLPTLKHPLKCLSRVLAPSQLYQWCSHLPQISGTQSLMSLNFWPSLIFSTKSEVRQNNFSHPWISEDIHEIFQILMQNNIGAQRMVPLSGRVFLSTQSCPSASLFQNNPGYVSVTIIPRHPLCFSKFWMTT